MADLNHCAFTGRLPRDPEPIGTTGGFKFSLANDGWDSKANAKTTTWVPCVAFGKTGDTVGKYLKKGSTVAVEGRFSQRDNPAGGKFTDIVVFQVHLIGPPPAGASSSNTDEGNDSGW